MIVENNARVSGNGGIQPEGDPEVQAQVQTSLVKWDSGDPVKTIEMGGMGEGYERGIQSVVFELLRQGDATTDGAVNAAVKRAEKVDGNGGFSGAQIGAARSLAAFVLKNGWKATLEKYADRQTEVSKPTEENPNTISPADAFAAGVEAAKKAMSQVKGPEGGHVKSTGGAAAGSTASLSPASLEAKLGKPIEIRTFGGAHIDEAVRRMIEKADATGLPHTATFNGTKLIANPGDDFDTVKAPFSQAMEEARERAAAREAEQAKIREQKLAEFDAPIVKDPPAGFELNPNGRWGNLSLITPDQLKQLPEGTMLQSINGEEAIVGIDDIDGDTRGGFLAYGFPRRSA